MLSLGEMIRNARKESNITMNELAEQLDITQGYLSKIENNKKIPSPDILNKLSKLLGISSIELMKRAGYIEENFKESFGDYLQILRNKKGLSLEELAEITDIPIDELSDLENSTQNTKLSQEFLESLSQALGITIFEILRHPDIKTSSNVEKVLYKYDYIMLEHKISDLREAAQEQGNLSENEKIALLNSIQELENLQKIYLDEYPDIKEPFFNIIYENEEEEKAAKEKERKNSEIVKKQKDNALNEYEIGNLFLFNENINYKGQILTTEQRRLLFEKVIEIMEKK